jgi:hypothetical protein
MTPLAHHAGEQSLATLLLLLGGGSLSVVVAIGWAQLAAVRARLPRSSGTRRSGLRAADLRSNYKSLLSEP